MPVVLFVAATVAEPETVSELEDESRESDPVVLTVTPVKVVLLLMLKVMGVIARPIRMLCTCELLVPVTFIV